MCCLHFVSDKKVERHYKDICKIWQDKNFIVIYFYQYLTNNQDQLFFAVDGIQIRFIIKRHIWQFKDNFRRIKNETQTLKWANVGLAKDSTKYFDCSWYSHTKQASSRVYLGRGAPPTHKSVQRNINKNKGLTSFCLF